MILILYFRRCSCKKASCITNRFACFKAGRKCNSRCHPKNASCRNHDQDLQGFIVDDNPFFEEEGSDQEDDDSEDEEPEDKEKDAQVSKKQKTK